MTIEQKNEKIVKKTKIGSTTINIGSIHNQNTASFCEH